MDGTVGGGGHTRALLEAGIETVICLDRDAEAIEAARVNLKSFGQRVTLVHSPFSSLPKVLNSLGLEHVDGVLVDLGVSSHQLDTASRGFGFRSTGPLDMRMNQSSGDTAADLLDQWSREELATVLQRYGEVPGAWRMAERILTARREGELETTTDLARVAEAASPRSARKRKIHPATLVFQAIRIAVNGELDELEQFLRDAPQTLSSGGRIAVISFQSLEDRQVKWQWRQLAGRVPKEGPALWFGDDEPADFVEVTRKPRTAGPEEVKENPRSRSAKLRVLERVAEEP